MTTTKGETMEFSDISSEQYREYVFPTGTVRIENPRQLNISQSGGHRIVDATRLSHYIPSGWIHLMWRVKPGEQPISF